METAIAFLLILLAAVWSGQVIMWRRGDPPGATVWSQRWHRTGFITRAALVALVYLETQKVGITMLAAFSSYVLYNAIIAIYMRLPWFYIGGTSWLDKTIPHWLHYVMYGLLLAAAIILTVKGV